MILRKEILKDKECPPELEGNLLELLERINKVRDAWSRPMIVTSGFRTKEDQVRIYHEKGIFKNIPMKSMHLYCQAVDIYDPERELQKWVMDNVDLMEEIGLWMEDFSFCKNWIHFQTSAPLSGKRFFIPGGN